VGCFICLEEVVSAERYAFMLPCCSQIIHLKCWETWEDVKKESGQDPSCPMCRTRWKGIIRRFVFAAFGHSLPRWSGGQGVRQRKGECLGTFVKNPEPLQTNLLF
jgi:hypothetical protein